MVSPKIKKIFSSSFPRWRRKPACTNDIVGPDERLPWSQMVIMGMQHVVAMFGATVLAPLLMGFDPNVAILMSGIGTLLFFVVVSGRVPSYLGSSFAFIGVVTAATGYSGSGPNPHISLALGGIISCGVVLVVIALVVMRVGTSWIEKLMPPVVTGSVVAAIGLNLAPIAAKNAMGLSSFDSLMAVITIICIALVSVFSQGIVQRLLILIGLIFSYLLYFLLANGCGWGVPIDFSPVISVQILGTPHFFAPQFDSNAISLIAPVAVILVAENLGHVKAIAAMTGRNLDPLLGRAFLGDGLATILSAMVGGTGVTTYAENIGVMAVTKVYSTLVFVLAAIIALGLGFSPKFGALIQTIPVPVMGGVSMVIFGLITVAGIRILMQNRVDLSDSRNLIVVAVTLSLGAGDFVLRFGNFTLAGIGTATFGAILLNALLRVKRDPQATHSHF